MIGNLEEYGRPRLRRLEESEIPAPAMVVIRYAISNHKQPKNHLRNHSHSRSRVAKASLLSNLISAWANKKWLMNCSWACRMPAKFMHMNSLCCQPWLRWRRCVARDPRAKPSKRVQKSAFLSNSLISWCLLSFFLMLRASAIPSEGTKLISGKCRRWASAKSRMTGEPRRVAGHLTATWLSEWKPTWRVSWNSFSSPLMMVAKLD